MIPFVKYQGTGNDFVAIDADDETRIDDPGAFAMTVCDRETGLGAGRESVRTGADGVLLLDLDADREPARVHMQLYQPDGGTAAMCGNGVRCVAAWAARQSGDSEPLAEIVVDTPAGERPATVHFEDGKPVAATVEMGTPSFEPADVPIEREGAAVGTSIAGHELTALTTGVPHAVAFVADVDAVDLDAFAPPIRHADAFPEGANVTVAARVDDGGSTADGEPDRPRFAQRTYERGVEGETRACGTGAVAILAAAKRSGRVEDSAAIVEPPGGQLRVTVPDEGPATLRGPVETTFSGTIPASPNRIADATIEVADDD